jgi:predicted phage-related endonuclease
MALVTYATREDWLVARRNSIGSSDSGVLWGPDCCYSSQSKYQLWCSKKLGLEVEWSKIDLRRLKAGQVMEPIIREWVADELGVTLLTDPPHSIRVSDDVSCMSASLDSFYDGFDGLVVVELKHVGPHNRHLWDDEQLPLIYAIQAAHQGIVTGATRAIVCGACGDDLFIRHVPLDAEFRASHIQACRDFWALVENNTPPEVDASEATTEALKRRFKKEKRPRIEVGDWLDEVTRELAELDEQAKATTKEIDLRKNRIRESCGESEGVISPNGAEWTWKNQQRKEYVVAASESRVLRRVGGRKKG